MITQLLEEIVKNTIQSFNVVTFWPIQVEIINVGLYCCAI